MFSVFIKIVSNNSNNIKTHYIQHVPHSKVLVDEFLLCQDRARLAVSSVPSYYAKLR